MRYNSKKQEISKTMTIMSVVMIAISFFSAQALFATEQSISGANIEGKASGNMSEKHVLDLKKKFIAQNLPTPKITGSVNKNAQEEDEAMISAIIFHDLKRSGQK